MLAYSTSADILDDYLCIMENITLDYLKKNCYGIIEVFVEESLRRPSEANVTRLLAVIEHCGFLGILVSVDCGHWEWKNYPTG